MGQNALINPELQEYQFYIQSMSLFLQNSFGMQDRCKMYVDFLKNILDIDNELYKKLNIFYYQNEQNNYFTLNQLNAGKTDGFYLDMIAAIFGLSRTLILSQVSYNDGVYTTTGIEESVTLTNQALLTYILATIYKNVFDGREISLRQIYTGSDICLATVNGIPVQESFLTRLNIVYCQIGTLIVRVSSFRKYGTTTIEQQLAQLFLSSKLTIESLGISYVKAIVAPNKIFGVFNRDEWDTNNIVYQ